MFEKTSDKTAKIWRMVMPGHVCPFGLKSVGLLPKVSVHSSSGRLLVVIVEPHSWHCEINSNKSSVPVLDNGTKPGSSMMSSLTVWGAHPISQKRQRRGAASTLGRLPSLARDPIEPRLGRG